MDYGEDVISFLRFRKKKKHWSDLGLTLLFSLMLSSNINDKKVLEEKTT